MSTDHVCDQCGDRTLAGTNKHGVKLCPSCKLLVSDRRAVRPHRRRVNHPRKVAQTPRPLVSTIETKQLSFATVHRFYQEAQAVVGYKGYAGNGVVEKQSWLRRVSAEFHRRLQAAGIPVEEGRAS